MLYSTGTTLLQSLHVIFFLPYIQNISKHHGMFGNIFCCARHLNFVVSSFNVELLIQETWTCTLWGKAVCLICFCFVCCCFFNCVLVLCTYYTFNFKSTQALKWSGTRLVALLFLRDIVELTKLGYNGRICFWSPSSLVSEMDTWLGLNHLHTKRVSKLRVRNILSLMVRELGCTPATERRDYFGTLFILLHLQRAVVGEVELALKKKSVCVCVSKTKSKQTSGGGRHKLWRQKNSSRGL